MAVIAKTSKCLDLTLIYNEKINSTKVLWVPLIGDFFLSQHITDDNKSVIVITGISSYWWSV